MEEEAHSLIEGALRSVRKDPPAMPAAGGPAAPPTPPGEGNPLYSEPPSTEGPTAGSEPSSGGGEDLVANFQRNSAALREEMLELRRSLEVVDAPSMGGLPGTAEVPSQAAPAFGEYTTILSDMKHRYGVGG